MAPSSRITVLKDLPNMFVKANFSFDMEGRSFDYINQFISAYGISGLRWSVSDPRRAVGMKTVVNVELLAGERERFVTDGLFTAERSRDSVYLGVRFLADRASQAMIDRALKNYGTVPTTHIRKYPRIPASEIISTMPLQAILDVQGELMGCRIANISPNGLLLMTENPKASLLEPGTRIRAQMEPRGDFFMSINVEGMICRILEDYNPDAKNVQRYLGVRITRFDEGHKESYLALLQDMLLKIKKASWG